ncbi:MAG: hypothetical protein ABSC38_06005 [Verrucomicrobiia bacterium]
MDFLKKHYDKILLAMAFILVIVFGSILVLKVNSLSRRLDQPNTLLEPPQKATYEQMDTRKYAEALNVLQHPPVWEATEVDLFPRGTPSQAVISNKPIAYLRLERLPFDLLFKAYSWDAEKNKAFNFQISLRDLTRAYFTTAVGDPVKDKFGDTGYSITKFEHKVENVLNPSIGHKVEVDRSELTLERPGEDMIVLELGKVHLRTESVATVVCQEDPQKEIQVRRGQSITCPSNTYIVVDMNEKQMVIKNSDTDKQDTIEKYQGVVATGSAGAVPSGPEMRTADRPMNRRTPSQQE